jgi:hypothetical protein
MLDADHQSECPGINMRYLGLLKSLLPHAKQGQASLLLVSMITRCLKNFIRAAVRTMPPVKHRATIIQYRPTAIPNVGYPVTKLRNHVPSGTWTWCSAKAKRPTTTGLMCSSCSSKPNTVRLPNILIYIFY